jgi:protein TonB
MIKHQSRSERAEIQLLPNRFVFGPSNKERVKRSHADYRKNFELGLVISLSVIIAVFHAWKRDEKKEATVVKAQISVDVVDDIPRTVHRKRVLMPTSPSVPIPSEDEFIPEDETIELTTLDLTEIPVPPLPPDVKYSSDAPVFVAFDEPPAPRGGMAAIQRNLVYPEIARTAGIEGEVILHIQIDDTGEVKTVKVVKSLNLTELDEAAINAVRSVKWKPAKQRDMAIAVWISVPIQFSLR